MKDQEEYEDYLVDKAKELLNQEVSGTEGREVPDPGKKRSDHRDEKMKNSDIPMAFDPQETEFLAENRKSMSNDEMKKFLEQESELQKKLQKIDDWKGFTRWEERLMVQKHTSQDAESIARELERDENEVRLKMRMLGLKVDLE
jgi:hypothetical protein